MNENKYWLKVLKQTEKSRDIYYYVQSIHAVVIIMYTSYYNVSIYCRDTYYYYLKHIILDSNYTKNDTY